MISLDQVLMLQKKVETAVEKIAFLKGQIEQLKSENDALHTKCAELTKALDEKTELVSSLESNQGKIEEGILSALNRLDTVENSLLDGSVAASEVSQDQQSPLDSEQSTSQNVDQQEQATEPVQPELVSEPVQEPFRYEIVPDEETSEEEVSETESPSEENAQEQSAPEQTAESNSDSLNGQFDIF